MGATAQVIELKVRANAKAGLTAMRQLKADIAGVKNVAQAFSSSFSPANATLKHLGTSLDSVVGKTGAAQAKIGGFRVALGGIGAGAIQGVKGVNSAFSHLTTGVEKSVQSFFSLKTAIAAIGLYKLASEVKQATLTFAGFDDSVRAAAAVAGEGTTGFNQLSTAAKKAGADTRYTASQAGEGLLMLSRAGFQVKDSVAALPTVLGLAAAGNLDLASSADIVTNMMTMYQRTADDLGETSDVLVSAFTGSNSTLMELGEAFKYVAPIANGLGVQFNDLISALAQLHNGGIKASMAGTTLRGVLDALFNPTKQEAELLAELDERLKSATGTGLKIKDVQGNFVGFTSIVKQLEQAGLKADEALRLFGLRAGPGMAALVTIGSGALEKFNVRLNKSAGETNRISGAMEGGLGGAIRRLKSALESFDIESIGKKSEFFIKEVNGMRDVVESLRNSLPNIMDSLELLFKETPINFFDRDSAGIAQGLLKVFGTIMETAQRFKILWIGIKFTISQFGETLFLVIENVVSGLISALNTVPGGSVIADKLKPVSEEIKRMRKEQEKVTAEFGKQGDEALDNLALMEANNRYAQKGVELAKKRRIEAEKNKKLLAELEQAASYTPIGPSTKAPANDLHVSTVNEALERQRELSVKATAATRELEAAQASGADPAVIQRLYDQASAYENQVMALEKYIKAQRKSKEESQKKKQAEEEERKKQEQLKNKTVENASVIIQFTGRTDGATGAVSGLRDAVQGLASSFKSIGSDIKSTITNLDSLASAARAAAQAVASVGGIGSDNVSTASGFASGGLVPGRSPHSRADNIPALLTAGEYVVPRDIVRRFGVAFFDHIKHGVIPKVQGYASGGLVGFKDPYESINLTPWAQNWARTQFGALNALGAGGAGVDMQAGLAGRMRNWGEFSFNVGGEKFNLLADERTAEGIARAIKKTKWRGGS